MNAYLFIVNGEAILIAARSMNDAEQFVIAEYEDISLEDLKNAQRLYTRKQGKAARTAVAQDSIEIIRNETIALARALED